MVGPFFFEETVNQEVHQNIIHQFIASLTVEERWCYFHQDGARAHTACATMEFLREFFGDRFISWSARSPDLTPPNFFLWGYVKDNVFKHNPTTIAELKTLIMEAVVEITPAMLKKIFINK